MQYDILLVYRRSRVDSMKGRAYFSFRNQFRHSDKIGAYVTLDCLLKEPSVNHNLSRWS